MKKSILKLFLFSLIISIFLNVFMFDKIANVYASETTSKIVIDAQSGRVLFEENASEKRSIASTTKVLTCITAIENFSVETKVKIKKEWTGVEGSSIYLKENEVFTVKELLYGLMLRSGNDSAVSIASSLCGDIQTFADLMNITARRAGAVNSSFKNPHGLECEGHYSTAYDMAMITRYALRDPLFSEIVNTKNIVIGEGQSRRVLNNKNKLLYNYEFATGVKTGYTKKAGRCLVSSASKNGFDLVCVVLNCGPMYEVSESLFEETYSKYERVKLIDKDISVCEVKCKNGEFLPAYCKKDIYYPLSENEKKDISFKINLLKSSKINPEFEEECGTIQIFMKNHLLFEEKIYTILK